MRKKYGHIWNFIQITYLKILKSTDGLLLGRHQPVAAWQTQRHCSCDRQSWWVFYGRGNCSSQSARQAPSLVTCFTKCLCEHRHNWAPSLSLVVQQTTRSARRCGRRRTTRLRKISVSATGMLFPNCKFSCCPGFYLCFTRRRFVKHAASDGAYVVDCQPQLQSSGLVM